MCNLQDIYIYHIKICALTDIKFISQKINKSKKKVIKYLEWEMIIIFIKLIEDEKIPWSLANSKIKYLFNAFHFGLYIYAYFIK